MRPLTGDNWTPQGRSLIDFKKMTESITGQQALKFNGYGNWCGLGGSGKAVDAVDKCCKVHDLCYENSSKGCFILGKYLDGYKWENVNGTIVCSAKNGPCETKYCACDKVAAECFNKSAYNEQNQGKVAKVVAKAFE